MYKIISSLLLLVALFGVTGFTIQEEEIPPSDMGQPAEERAEQDTLPQSDDEIWSAFVKCKVDYFEDEKKGLYGYNIQYTPEVKAMEGKEVTISGFMLPLESTEKFKHFILSKRTPTCPFCPPGEPNEIVDVWLDTSTAWNEDIISVTGKLSFISDQELGMFFKLSNAKIFVPHPPEVKQQTW